ncbi:MAG: cadherin-like domain-containing protein [Saprospiraceae bacterium]|nr:cadherin-like domain-containing protein [Saprospiraceae bacterium]
MKTHFLLFALVLSSCFLYAQSIEVKQSDKIKIDNGTVGKANAGDVIQYKVNIQNTGGANATGVQLNAVPDTKTTFVNGSFLSTSVAVNDAYTCTGNVGIDVPAANGVLINDFDDNLGGATLTCNTCNPTTNGGTVTLNNDGSFMYVPAAGYIGSDQFTYTINDATIPDGATPIAGDITATVTITISNMIWFIDNSSVAALSDGRRSSPFKTLASFESVNGTGGLNPAAGHTIYIEHTGTNYAGGVSLENNQIVIGEGHSGTSTMVANENLSVALSFALAPFSLALPNIDGSRPVIVNAGGDGVTLAANNNLRGFDVGNCSDFGIDDNGNVGTLTINEVSITNGTGGGIRADAGGTLAVTLGSVSSTGGANGINLGSVGGTFTTNGGTISNPTGTGVQIQNGTVVFSYSGNISDNTGFAVDIDNHDSGNVTFSGNITSTAQGIQVQNCGGGTKTFSGSSKSLTTTTNNAVTLANNAGATIDFTGGGLAITTTSGMGFSATGGGTVNVTGSANTINSTGGATALNVANTNIGSSNLNFQSISSNGSTATGIILNTTGTAGGLIVNGDGSNMTLGGNSSGGTIAGKSGADGSTTSGIGIYLNNTRNVILRRMTVNGTNQNFGIRGSSVVNYTMEYCTIGGTNGTNVGLDEGSVIFTELTGSATVTNCHISGAVEHNMSVINTSGLLDRITVTGSTFGSMNTMTGSDGLLLETQGTAVINSTITNNNFTFAIGDHFQLAINSSTTNDIVFTGNTISNTGVTAVSGGRPLRWSQSE